MSKQIVVYKQGGSEPLAYHDSLKEAAKIYFKGVSAYQKKIQKSCSGRLKTPIESSIGLIYFRYKN
jgi:hypothetical protein